MSNRFAAQNAAQFLRDFALNHRTDLQSSDQALIEAIADYIEGGRGRFIHPLATRVRSRF